MGRKLFVGNLSFDTTDTELKEAFSKAGTCVSATIVKDRETGRPRGFGFVEMGSDEEMQRAVSMLHGSQLGGRAINVNEARERSDRPAGPRPEGTRPGPPRNFGPPRTSGGPPRGFGPSPEEPDSRFRKEGKSRRGIRARKRSL